jgi:hypothetical protein
MKPVNEGRLYAVLLGPFHDKTEKTATTEKLRSAQFAYFERPEEKY